MPPTRSLATQLRERAVTLEVYLRDRATETDATPALIARGLQITVGELRDLSRLVRRAADSLEPVTDDAPTGNQPFPISQRINDDSQPDGRTR